MTNKFICPSCKSVLNPKEKALVCENGHSYDIARQGYVHLLMSNKMHSKNPGDTKEMVDARRSFLEKGYYDIFANKICELIEKYGKNAEFILDAGCGEGYYSNKYSAVTKAEIVGFDISKFAVKSASAKYKHIDFAVASCFNIPIKENSCDILLNVFSPMAESEFLRVLKKDGIFIYAIPGKRHLFELKEVLYEKPYENEEKDSEYKGLVLLDRISVKGKISLSKSEDIWNLFSMTPYYWKTDIKGSQKLKETEKLDTEIHFDFLVYQKNK
ncbi:MAG: methyltransferase domain-containing protein [Clostridia bacterium]